MATRTRTWLAIVAAVLLTSCVRIPDIGITKLKPESLARLQTELLGRKAEIEQFRLRGPFEVTVHEDRTLHLSRDEPVEVDVYLSEHKEKAPLVILVHGLDNAKEDHAYQAHHLASWGLHAVVVQLPNQGPWIRNGQILARLVVLLRQRPESIDPRVNPGRIVLAGHSYGGSSVAVALAEGAPAVGGVLLDPAGTGNAVIKYLGRVTKPVIVLGADRNVMLTRNRFFFYRYIPHGIAEVSIRGAHHADAQFPLHVRPRVFGTDSGPTEALQITFVSALTAAAFSLASTGKVDYAWAGYQDAVRAGRMFGPQRK